MVRHILHGELTTFFWGQAYGGSQEALLTAPLFAVAGSGWLTLRLIPIGLSGVAALLVWRVGRRTIGEPAATVAAAISLVWPPFLVYKLTHQWGFYASGVVYCGLVLLLALRVVEQPSRLRVGLFAFVLGLALWEDEQLVPIMLPVIAWTIWRRPRCLRHLWLAAPLAVLGALPWLLWNIQHGWASFSSNGIPDTTTYQHRLRVFASPLLPMLLGLRVPFTQKPLTTTVLSDAVYVGLIGLFVYGAYRARHRNTSLLYVVVAGFPLVYAVSPQTLFSQEPKYLLVLSPALVLLLAQAAGNRARAVAVFGLACAVSLGTLHRMDTYFRTAPPSPQKAPSDIRPLIHTLESAGVSHVYATFWASYRISFDSNERIIASQNRLTHLAFVQGRAFPPHDPYIRYRSYEREVDADSRHGFVFFEREPNPITRELRQRSMAQLAAHGYLRHRIGIFIVFTLATRATSSGDRGSPSATAPGARARSTRR
jgi:hypothetical protein